MSNSRWDNTILCTTGDSLKVITIWQWWWCKWVSFVPCLMGLSCAWYHICLLSTDNSMCCAVQDISMFRIVFSIFRGNYFLRTAAQRGWLEKDDGIPSFQFLTDNETIPSPLSLLSKYICLLEDYFPRRAFRIGQHSQD